MNKIRIVAFGDAVTAGTSAKLDVLHDCFQYGTTKVNQVRETQTWRSIAARIMSDWIEGDVEIINAGVSGDTSSKGLARMERDVLSQSPDTVLVMFGAEDVLQDVETKAFRENIEKIVDGIKVRNAKPVLMTPTPISERMTAAGCTLEELRCRQERLSALAQAVRSLAEEKSLDLIDLNHYFLDTRLAYDHLYEGWLPDAVAQTGMASFIAGELLPMLGVKNFPKPVLCDYRKVYSDDKRHDTRHNGFTDITYFQDAFYLTFRSGAYHGAGASGEGGGKTIVLRSADGITWVEDGVFEVEGFQDTRDPKFLQVDDRLLVYAISWPDARQAERVSVVFGFERLDTGRWSEPFKCASHIFWRPRKWRDGYAVAGYDWKFDTDKTPDKTGYRHFSASLFQSPDGRHWEKTSTIMGYETDANETELFVEDDTLMAFSRTQEGGNHATHISTYIPSENRWESVSSGRMIHAPCAFKAGKRTIIMGRYCSQSDERFRELYADWQKFTNYVQQPDEEGVRTVAEATGVDPARIEEYHHGLRTGVFVMDGTRPRLVMELLSAGDSSYTGAVQYGDEYVISDYSMHEYYPEIKRPRDWETPCDIYVSRIRFVG